LDGFDLNYLLGFTVRREPLFRPDRTSLKSPSAGKENKGRIAMFNDKQFPPFRLLTLSFLKARARSAEMTMAALVEAAGWGDSKE
jgi:hypothetical protein